MQRMCEMDVPRVCELSDGLESLKRIWHVLRCEGEDMKLRLFFAC